MFSKLLQNKHTLFISILFGASFLFLLVSRITSWINDGFDVGGFAIIFIFGFLFSLCIVGLGKKNKSFVAIATIILMSYLTIDFVYYGLSSISSFNILGSQGGSAGRIAIVSYILNILEGFVFSALFVAVVLKLFLNKDIYPTKVWDILVISLGSLLLLDFVFNIVLASLGVEWIVTLQPIIYFGILIGLLSSYHFLISEEVIDVEETDLTVDDSDDDIDEKDEESI